VVDVNGAVGGGDADEGGGAGVEAVAEAVTHRDHGDTALLELVRGVERLDRSAALGDRRGLGQLLPPDITSDLSENIYTVDITSNDRLLVNVHGREVVALDVWKHNPSLSEKTP